MKTLILSFSANKVDEESYIPYKKGLTFTCVDKCLEYLTAQKAQVEHICLNYKKINRCLICGAGGWGKCWSEHKCALNDDFNEIYDYLKTFANYIFITPVYFSEMSESAKAFFDRLKRCDAFNDQSQIKGKKIICIACAGGSGSGTSETLNSFAILSSFLNTEIVGSIPVTRFNYEQQIKLIEASLTNLIK